MKRILALLLALVMCFGMFAGCKGKEPTPTDPVDAPAPDAPAVAVDENLEKAIEYLQVFYKDTAEKTAMDYTRIGTVRIANIPYEIVWTVSVSEDIIKVVQNADGTYTIDINEEAIAETTEPIPYTLTATVTGTDGRQLSLSWELILPAAIDQEAIDAVNAAYELTDGEMLDGTYTLTGRIISVDTPYSSQYGNITVTIEIKGVEEKPIKCYRLKGEGAESLFVDDIITVTGKLKNYKGTIEFDQGCVLEAVQPGPRVPVEVPTDPKQIVKDAFALPTGGTLYQGADVTLTGTVTKVDYSHKPGADNMSVTIRVEGKNIYCFYLTGSANQLSQINVNDIITVKGPIKNYQGKVEFDHPDLMGLTNRPEPKGETDVAKILADAANLGNGKYLYLSTMTGIITKITSPYSSQYGNISFEMLVDGTTTTILCYRVSGKSAPSLQVGDQVSVTGSIQNYNGTIEYVGTSNSGANPHPATVTLLKAGVGVPETPVDGFHVDFSKLQTTEQYKETTVDLGDGYSLHIVDSQINGSLRLYDSKAGVNDAGEAYEGHNGIATFTSPEVIKNVQMTAGYKDTKLAVYGSVDGQEWTLVETLAITTSFAKHAVVMPEGTAYKYLKLDAEGAQVRIDNITFNGTVEEEPPVSDDPAADSILSVEKAIALGASKEHNIYTENKYYVYGTITEIYNTQYGNMKITDDAGNILTIYGTWSADGKTRFDALDVKPVVGDVVKLYGVIGQYNNTPQMKNGWIMEINPTDIPVLKDTLTVAEAIAMGAAMEHNIYTQDKYYVTGKITEIYNTQYGNMKITDDAGNILTIYGTYDATGENRFDAMTAQPAVGDTVKLYGVIGQYNGTPQMKNGWIIAINGEGGDTPDVPDVPATGYVTDASKLSTDAAYKLGLYSTAKEATYYFTGAMSGYYGATETDIALAADMKLEKANGGWYLTFNDGTKQYVNIVASGTHINFTFAPTATTVFTFDDEVDALCTVLDGTTYFMGTYSNYVTVGTMSADKVDTSYVARLYVAGGAETPDPKPEDPTGETLTVAQAIELGASKEHNVYTEDKYYVTGKITEIYNTQYGNMKITDEAGNILTIYGTYDATGENRFDAMTAQPAVGDTVKLYGIIGQYNGTPQMKNGWIMEINAGEGGETPDPKPEDPALETLTALPKNGDVIVIANGTNVMTGNGFPKLSAATLEEGATALPEGALNLTVITDGTYYAFTDASGNYLTSGATGSGIFLEKEANRYSLWTIAQGEEGIFFIKSVNAKYNGKVQTIEYYNGFTTYSDGTGTAYQLTLYITGTGASTKPMPENKNQQVPVESDLTSAQAIMDVANALYKGEELPYTLSLTGTITEVETDSKGNVSATIAVAGTSDTILCYQIQGEAADLKAGDKITATGTIKNHNGTVEFAKPSFILEEAGSETPDVPGDDTVTLVKKDLSEITADDAVVIIMSKDDVAYALLNGAVTGTDGAKANAVAVDLADLALTKEALAGMTFRFAGNTETGYYIYANGQNVNTLYAINNNNGLRLNENGAAEANLWKLVDGYLVASNADASNVRYMGVYLDGPNFRTYTSVNTNIAGQTLSFYVWQGAASGGEIAAPEAGGEETPDTGLAAGNYLLKVTHDGVVYYAGAYDGSKGFAVETDIANAVPYYISVAADGTVTIADAADHTKVYGHKSGNALNVMDAFAWNFIDNGDGTYSFGCETDAVRYMAFQKNGDKFYWRCYKSTSINTNYTASFALEAYSGSVEAPKALTPEEIKAAIATLEDGKFIPGDQTLTGTITEIGELNKQYNSRTGIIAVDGYTDWTITFYGMIGDGIADLKVGDKITVTGAIKNYQGLIEFNANCTFVLVTAGEGGETGGEEEGGTTGKLETPAEIMAAAYALADGEALEGTFTLTGTVVKMTDLTSYNDRHVTIAVEGTDKELYCYCLKGDGIENLKVGDKITVTGTIKNYKGTIEFDKGCTFVTVSAAAEVVAIVPEEPVVIEEPKEETAA